MTYPDPTAPPPPRRDTTLPAVRGAARQQQIRPDGIDYAISLLGDLRRYELPGHQLDHAALDADLAVIARQPDMRDTPEQRAYRQATAADAMSRSTGLRLLPPAPQAPAPLRTLPTGPPPPPADAALAQRIAAQMAAAVNGPGATHQLTVRPPDDAA